MNNNKQSIKLYTEEQIFKAIQMADKYHYLITSEECDIVNLLTPIELPSDEEIETQCGYEEDVYHRIIYKAGIKFVLNKIQGGNK